MINEDKIRQVYASDPKKGFKMLMDNFQVPIYNYIRRLVVSHEDAEDVLQEVFIRVYRNLEQFRGESSLTTWIHERTKKRFVRKKYKKNWLVNWKLPIILIMKMNWQSSFRKPYWVYRKNNGWYSTYAIMTSLITKRSAGYWIARSILWKWFFTMRKN